jgi:hypothetical protein
MTIGNEPAIGPRRDVGGDPSREPCEEKSASFAELVYAHHLRQKELFRAARSGAPSDEVELDGPADGLYRRRLAAFEREEGRILRAYWCTYEISAVAITEQEVSLPWWRLRRRDRRLRLHMETDWATRDSPELAHQLHKVDNLTVRADEVLRGTGEHIAMQLLLAAASHVLSYVDRKEGAPRDPAVIRRIVERSDAEQAEIRRYYDRAGENAARIVYAGGMLAGVVLLAVLGALAGLVLWAAGSFDGKHASSTWAILACVAAGGIGAGVSVLQRMARGNFAQDYEVGRKATRRLAMARPFVGAAFAVLIFLGLKSGLIDVGNFAGKARTIYFYATVGFLAGFSERWARVIIGSVLDGEDAGATPEKREPEQSRKPQPTHDVGDEALATVPEAVLRSS